ncbi:MAG: hypothetical protein HY898_07330 [Deltaproteobacteria bacterium]|nr:hypothetical protein [Deltaproteobacteria bacterium]
MRRLRNALTGIVLLSLGCDSHWLAAARVVDPHGAPLAGTKAAYLCPSDQSPTGWADLSLVADNDGVLSRDEMHRFDEACKVRIEREGFKTREVSIGEFCQYEGTRDRSCPKLPEIVLVPAR